MSELISGKEALIALANGQEVESRHKTMDEVWDNAKCLSLVETFLDPDTPREFRIKPNTISINGIEVPKPFKPNEGDLVWVICNYPCGYKQIQYSTHFENTFGEWKSEEEVTQVVEALRQIFSKKEEE